MKQAIIIAALTALAGCATGMQNSTYAAAAETKAACKPPPKELVKQDLAAGEGKEAVLRSAVLVSYTGWIYDGCKPDLKGAKFDSSEGRATPFGFLVGAGRVIKGWDEGVIGMKVHGKRLLVIPPDKAYGDRGAPGGKIKPGETLVFEVELIDVPYEPPKPQ